MTQLELAEKWLPIVGYEDTYAISNLGRVKIIKSSRPSHVGRIMKQSLSTRGYCIVCLHKNKQKSTKLVHRLVSEAFIGPCPKGRQVAHNDGVKTNNFLTNLRYATPLENIRDREKHGRTVRGSKSGSAKLDEIQVGIIYKLKNSGISSYEMGYLVVISPTNINRIWNKKIWKQVTE